MNKLIAILEDDERRAEMMRQEIAQNFPSLDCMIFENAPDMITWLKDSVGKVVLMSLDHDLGPNSERDGKVFNPGVGRDVVDFLEIQKPICPVIIHTTNRFGGDGMRYALEEAGWTVKRIVPFDDLSWIKNEWIKIIAKLIEEFNPEWKDLYSELNCQDEFPPSRE